MTTTVDLATVADSISKLSVSGVTIKDIDQVTDSMRMSPKTLCPRPEDYITGLGIVADESSSQWNTLRYTLNYRYYHCAIAGGLGGLFSSYSGLLQKVTLILAAFAKSTSLAGAMDNGKPRVAKIGPVQDPKGNWFLGCEISIDIMQFLEA
jgi:hypothetical protein